MAQKQSMLKKTAAATLALTMLVGGTTGLMASANGKDKGKSNKKSIHLDFGDLNNKEWKWAYDHVIRLAAQGVFNGYDDGSFKPRNNISRIEAIVAAVRLLGLKEEAEKPENMNAKLNFKDFDQLKKKYGWAVGYVAVALENDLFSEYEMSVQPEKPATRLWASVLLVKAMKLEAEAKTKMDTELPFRDAKDIPAGSVGYIAVALEKNIITGIDVPAYKKDHDRDDDDRDHDDNDDDGDNEDNDDSASNSYNKIFLPNKPVTRAELATLLDRVDQQLPETGNAQAIIGTITAIDGSNLTVKKADNTSVTVAADANVFIFRKDVKSPLSSLQVGDQALVRTFEGKAVFIEVTKTADAVAFTLNDAGKISNISLNAQGKIATLTIVKTVNGTQQTTIYNVDSANLKVTGNNGILSTDLNVVVRGNNGVIQEIDVTA
ncbi:S-layer homology domain-containing protein [Cohnella suwonensis]|uniref:S-layer homology domain-containing protein n=1 Tax=Cohnella suwonensis TaxID=696072 RepID=A0ABW0LUI9_9BACL